MFTFQNGKKSARKETKTHINLHLFSDSRSTPSNQFFRSMDNILQWLGWVQKHWWIWNHLLYHLFCQIEFIQSETTFPCSQDRVSPNNFLCWNPKVRDIFKPRNLGILQHLPPVAVAVSIVPNLRQPPGTSWRPLRRSMLSYPIVSGPKNWALNRKENDVYA